MTIVEKSKLFKGKRGVNNLIIKILPHFVLRKNIVNKLSCKGFRKLLEAVITSSPVNRHAKGEKFY